jgi:hypothetical protein
MLSALYAHRSSSVPCKEYGTQQKRAMDQALPKVEDRLMRPHETWYLACDHCHTQFAVTLEPDKPSDYWEGRTVLFCPFCGDDDIYVL